ncbi:MAG: DUF3089 domain-containing protein [Pseudomonadales bacterium]|nr:DUF3089 domain-containing protein [Pseudomonadales bacterium]
MFSTTTRLIFGASLLLGGLLSTGQSLAQEAVDYSQASAWLCRPDSLQACATDLTTTVVAADGSMKTEQFQHNPDAAIDCFYVYPTVSRDTTANSDMNAGPEELNVIAAQFARMGAACRPFAPLYRQVTLTALRANLGGGQGMAPDRELGYRDVVDAWNHYLSHDNNGRGVILVGHSQGSGVLARLISTEIEGKPVQNRIISAMLLGTSVQVPKGKLVGSTFKQMPLCQSAQQTGCIITYASFRDTVPPPQNSLFGRGSDDTESACTNPALLAKGSKELHAYLSNSVLEGASSAPPAPWTHSGQQPQTPFVSVPGLLSAECVNNGSFSYLQVTVNANPDDPRTDTISGDVIANGQISANWGLHLIDVNMAMGDLVSIARQQGAAWLAKQ